MVCDELATSVVQGFRDDYGELAVFVIGHSYMFPHFEEEVGCLGGFNFCVFD